MDWVMWADQAATKANRFDQTGFFLYECKIIYGATVY